MILISEKCPHCGMAWSEAMGEYECGSYPAGSSVVRATACTEIARLQAQLAHAERVVVPELDDDETDLVITEFSDKEEWPDDGVAEDLMVYVRWGVHIGVRYASRAHSIPASRVLKDGEVAVSAIELGILRDFA